MCIQSPIFRIANWVVAVLVLSCASIAQARVIELGQPTDRLVSDRNGQILYTAYAPEGGLMFVSPNFVLQVDGIDTAGQRMTFTCYNHMGTPHNTAFWVKQYSGDIAFPGTASTGWLRFTTRYIGGRPYPITNPGSMQVRFVPMP